MTFSSATDTEGANVKTQALRKAGSQRLRALCALCVAPENLPPPTPSGAPEVARIIAKNGYYAPVISILIYSLTDDLYLTSAIGLKLCSANYFAWYYPTMDFRFANKRWNILKQFVRFTDTGHFVNLLYFASSRQQLTDSEDWRLDIWPIAFNVHFAITFGYWTARMTGGIMENYPDDPEYNTKFDDAWTWLIHGLPLVFLTRDRLLSNAAICPYYGTAQNGWISLCWIYIWFFAIYLPWRLRTGDAVYSVLDEKKTHVLAILGASCMIQLFLLAGNFTAGILMKF